MPVCADGRSSVTERLFPGNMKKRSMQPNRITVNIISLLVAIVIFVIAGVVPVGYFFFAYQNMSGSLTAEAEIKAKIITQIISVNPEMWQFEDLKIQECLDYRPEKGLPETRLIYNNENEIIAKSVDELKRPVMTRSAGLFDSGFPVGRLYVSRSVRPLLVRTGALGLLMAALGAIAFLILRLLPIRAVSRAGEEVARYRENLEKLVRERTSELETANAALQGEINERKLVEKELEAATAQAIEEKSKTEAIIAAVGYGISVQGLDYKILYQNQQQKDLFGDHSGEYCYAAYRDRDTVCEGCYLALSFKDGKVHTKEQSRETAEGPIYVEITSSPLKDPAGRVIGGIEVVRDITDRKRMEELVKYQAHYDFLTDLPNRKLLMDRLIYALAQAHRSGQTLAVMFLDLDRFKAINDALGHTTGDHLLKKIAAQIKTCIRESDTVARFGGDEFAILLPQITCADDASRIAGKILSMFKKPFTIDGHELHITPSIGISICPDDGEYAETLLKHADIAMYHAKDQGKNNYQFYDQAINIRTLEQMILENNLRRTLQRGELAVYYQPQVDIHTGQIVCAEALVRWQHPELGLLNPMKFIPLAEEIGLIVPIGEWVLRTACTQNKAWQDEGYLPIGITVNLSAHQLQQPDLVEMVEYIVHTTGLGPRFLELEITESTAMQNIERIIPNLDKLSEMGIRFAIDDFGIGYSSLNYLKELPVQKLKIDKSFIFGLDGDPDYKAIVGSVIAMAHSLKLEVVAEGVETDDQLEFLRSAACSGVQGFIFSRPLPAEKFRELLVSADSLR